MDEWIINNIFFVVLIFFAILIHLLHKINIFHKKLNEQHFLLNKQHSYSSLIDGVKKFFSKNDRVEFSVFSESTIEKKCFHIDVWAYLPIQYNTVISLGKRFGRDYLLHSKHGILIERSSTLDLILKIDKLEIEEPHDTLTWNGLPTNSSFVVRVPYNVKPGMYPGNVLVYSKGFIICKLPFIIDIRYLEEDKQKIQINLFSKKGFYPNTAFASYAHEDRAEVLSRIHGMKKLAPEMDVFIDVFSLRSGQDWESKLEQHVPNKDVFFLFWSHFAAQSEWVEREWKLALKKRGLNYIDPVPLENSEVAPPPNELSKLHFNDPYVSYIQYEKYNKAKKAKKQSTDEEKV